MRALAALDRCWLNQSQRWVAFSPMGGRSYSTKRERRLERRRRSSPVPGARPRPVHTPGVGRRRREFVTRLSSVSAAALGPPAGTSPSVRAAPPPSTTPSAASQRPFSGAHRARLLKAIWRSDEPRAASSGAASGAGSPSCIVCSRKMRHAVPRTRGKSPRPCCASSESEHLKLRQEAFVRALTAWGRPGSRRAARYG
jgi:hypothetical protein